MIALAFLLFIPLDDWTTHGPGEGAYTTQVVVAAGDGRRVFAAASESVHDNGIYRSDDGGASWERVADSPGPDWIEAIAADPHDPDRLFVTTFHAGFPWFEARLFRSDDAGATWTQEHFAQVSTSSSHVVFDASDPRIVYVAYDGLGAIYRSVDGGDNFSEVPLPFPSGYFASSPDGSLVAASGWEIWVSRDHGGTWAATASAPIHCPTRSVAVDANDSLRWFAGTGQTESPCGELIVTEDGGSTWALAGELAGPVIDIVPDPDHPGVVYAAIAPNDGFAFFGRVLVSSDWGSRWIDLRLPVQPGACSLALGEGGSRLYAATFQGVYELSFRRTMELPPR